MITHVQVSSQCFLHGSLNHWERCSYIEVTVWTEPVVFMYLRIYTNVYVTTIKEKEAMTLKESKSIWEVWRRKLKGEMMWLYYNLLELWCKVPYWKALGCQAFGIISTSEWASLKCAVSCLFFFSVATRSL